VGGLVSDGGLVLGGGIGFGRGIVGGRGDWCGEGGYSPARRSQILSSQRKSKKIYVELSDHERPSYLLSSFTNLD